jgi:hypothetical protein
MLLLFNDGLSKTIDFKPFIDDCGISAPLKDPSYFSKVKIYDNGRGIYWLKELDCCPDYLHDYTT